MGDDLAIAVDLEGAVAAVGGVAGGQGDLEEALALDGQVEGVAGGLQVALFVDARDTRQLDAVARLDPRRHDAVGGRGGEAATVKILDQKVAEFRLSPLEPRGVQVGEVVGDDLDGHLLGEHARRRDA